jgi:hypothetical protein
MQFTKTYQNQICEQKHALTSQQHPCSQPLPHLLVSNVLATHSSQEDTISVSCIALDLQFLFQGDDIKHIIWKQQASLLLTSLG